MNLKQKLIRFQRSNVPSKLRNWTVANLIDDIHWQYTQWVMGLECSRGTFFQQQRLRILKIYNLEFQTEFLEGALCHPWEDPGHGVDPVLRVLLHHAGHLRESKYSARKTKLSKRTSFFQFQEPECHKFWTLLPGRRPWGRCCRRCWGSRWTRWSTSWTPRCCGCSGFPRGSVQAPIYIVNFFEKISADNKIVLNLWRVAQILRSYFASWSISTISSLCLCNQRVTWENT